MLPDACRACTGSSSPPAMARSLPADCLTSPHLTAPTMHLMLPPHLLSLPNLPTMLSPPNLPATTAAHLHRDLHPHPRIPRLAGGQMSDIVKLTTYLTDMDDYRDFVEVRSEFIAPPYPAATLVAVSALVRPEWLLEVEAVAVIE